MKGPPKISREERACCFSFGASPTTGRGMHFTETLCLKGGKLPGYCSIPGERLCGLELG